MENPEFEFFKYIPLPPFPSPQRGHNKMGNMQSFPENIAILIQYVKENSDLYSVVGVW